MSSALLTQFAVGFVGSLALALGAWRLRALTADGAAAAIVVGSLVVGFGGWAPGALVLLFFLSSSLLTRWGEAEKPQPEHGRGRSAVQVAAHGTVVTLCALWSGFDASPVAVNALAAALAASTADTWATELGLLSKVPTRLFTTGKQVAPGRSGGVTSAGTLAGSLGATFIAAAATWWLGTSFPLVWVAGTSAMMLDSVAGATIEGKRRWFGNEAVDSLMTAAAALLVIVTRYVSRL